jgi:hypothetical protein
MRQVAGCCILSPPGITGKAGQYIKAGKDTHIFRVLGFYIRTVPSKLAVTRHLSPFLRVNDAMAVTVLLSQNNGMILSVPAAISI